MDPHKPTKEERQRACDKVIPAGVAHALRVEGSRDAIMVYGTTTSFEPAFEGRIADGIERAPLPAEWQAFIDGER